jgi:hypothetical protein
VLIYNVPARRAAAGRGGHHHRVDERVVRAAGRSRAGRTVRRVLTELSIRRYRLDEIAAAHDAVEAGAVGKVVVDLLPDKTSHV